MKKLKRFLIAIVAIVVFATCSVCFVACDNNDNNNNNSNNNQTLTREELSAAFKDSASAAFELLGYDNSKTKKALMSASYNIPVVGEELDESGTDIKHLKANAISCVALVNMVGDLYANENFPITEKAVNFNVDYMTRTANFTILPKVNKDENIVEMEIIFDVAGTVMYYYFQLNYDFESQELSSFSIHIVIVGTPSDNYQCQRMSDGKFYMSTSPSQEYINAIASIKTDFFAKKETGISLEADFQTEFDAYTAISQKAFLDASK